MQRINLNRPRLPRERENIWPNQVGHLTSSTNNQIRYYSSASWVSALEDWEQASSSTAEEVASPGPRWSLGLDARGEAEIPTEQIDRVVSFGEVDRLIRWYSDFCHFWYPIVDLSETVASLENLRNHRPSASGSAALIAAVCYIASCSAEASRDTSAFSLASSAWRDLAQGFLAKSGYPSRPNPNSLRAAFLLALRNMTEFPSHTNPAPICVLMISSEGRPDRRMLRTITLVNVTLCKVFEDIYGVRQPTRDVLQRLGEEVEKLCASELQVVDSPDLSAVERFIAISLNCCLWKLKFVLHQPYLRSAQWPQSSRSKALDACKNYINAFTVGASEPPFAPFRWILNHFNIFHACAILLQDLIQHAGSLESSDLRSVVESCFSTFFKEADPIWEKLEALRSKAWTANVWHTPSQEDVDLGDVDLSLSDWDPLFASFIWHGAFAPVGDFLAG
ncbi:hypothetical protein NKR23_g5431 [Pleurostoma richardsiae]|uniref:Transcription factor n=1 Tax=Pleurostoma richardsiae TaxID=41990 RepID=A0AA38RZK7_9PEZI|nr:hypothetical protein NKR23_g5431 [Pleurostoma richardsiae]